MSSSERAAEDWEWAVVGEPLAEAAVLGCILRGGPVRAAELLDGLVEDDWTVPAHAHVAAAARTLLRQGVPVDPVTVLGQLRRRGMQHAGTASRDAGVLLVELCQAAPCVSSAGHYLRIVLEHSYRRRAQQAAVRLQQVAATGGIDLLHEVIDRECDELSRAWQRVTNTSGT